MLQEWLESGPVEMTLNNNETYETGELLDVFIGRNGKVTAMVKYKDGRVSKVDFAEFDRWQGMVISS